MSFYKKKKESVDPATPPNDKQMTELSLSQMEEEGKLMRELSDKELRRNSKKIDLEIRKERYEREGEEDDPRVLVLGPSDSGKSTLLKQLRILHGNGFTEKEIESYRSQMYLNILSAAAIIVKHCTLLDLWPEEEGHKEKFSVLENYDESNPTIDIPTKNLIASLWKEVYVQSGLDTKRFPVQDNAGYFLSRVDTLCDPTYVLKNENILNIRTETLKITETKFIIEKQKFHFYDVSGKKSQRKYWVPYFDNVHTILFVASLASYDLIMEEAPFANRMMDAISLFKEICEVKLLSRTKKLLFLNKIDLFKKKCKINIVRKYIPEAPNGTNIDELVDYFIEEFSKQSDNPKSLRVHVTCCTDEKKMQVIVSTVVKELIQKNLEAAGLIPGGGKAGLGLFRSPSY